MHGDQMLTRLHLKFVNGSKPFCPISLNLGSNNRHIFQLVLGSSDDKLAEHPRVTYTFVLSPHLAITEINQLYTPHAPQLHVQKKYFKHYVTIKLSLFFQ